MSDSARQASSQRHRVLLVEDDVGDAILVQALLDEGLDHWDVTWVQTVDAARRALDETIACVLVDLSLPDAQGLEALTSMLAQSRNVAVVVLTGLMDEHRGAEAVASGAQDYLVKGSVDGAILSRAIRYAVERKRTEETSRRLYDVEMRRRQNDRLARGLLPTPLLHDESFALVTRYRPGGGQIELGGDFYDVVQLSDGSLRAVIGDVAGHGPDEAAIGVALRAAWRALVLAGHDAETTLPALQAMLCSERKQDELFVTCCDIRIAADQRSAQLCLAGHPAPLLLVDTPVSSAGQLKASGGPALGLIDEVTWQASTLSLPPTWSLLFFTDGLIEGWAENSTSAERTGARERLSTEGLEPIVVEHWENREGRSLFVDNVIADVEQRNGADLADDVAVVLLSGFRAR